MKTIVLTLIMLLGLVSCNDSTSTPDSTYYTPTPYYTCSYVWDTWSGNYVHACYWVYYSEDGNSSQELDMVADVADKESITIDKTATLFSEKYSLSFNQAQKMARNVYDLQNLKDRTMEDLADFAQKLYGVNTMDLVNAISNAQVGDNQALDSLINEAAIEFNTNTQMMKKIIKDLHREALEVNGINL